MNGRIYSLTPLVVQAKRHNHYFVFLDSGEGTPVQQIMHNGSALFTYRQFVKFQRDLVQHETGQAGDLQSDNHGKHTLRSERGDVQFRVWAVLR